MPVSSLKIICLRFLTTHKYYHHSVPSILPDPTLFNPEFNPGKRFAEHQAYGLVALYTNTIRPLAEHYISWALGNLAGEAGAEFQRRHERISDQDQRQILCDPLPPESDDKFYQTV